MRTVVIAALIALTANAVFEARQARSTPSDTETVCRELLDMGWLTITLAEFRTVADSEQKYCHVRGTIAPGIRYHVELPVPSRWNGRLLAFGDGGKDGLVFSTNPFIQRRVLEGYVVVNSNSGHDAGIEPGSSFGYNNRQAEIDYGYRAVHVSTVAAKLIARTYYGRDANKSYFDGCSAGGRQGLMEAQRFPGDFDGILAGAPALYFQLQHVNRLWMLQKVFAANFADNLAFDSDSDGRPDDSTKVTVLAKAVLAKCDAIDGISDGVIDDPTMCRFNPAVDLAPHMCAAGANRADCFTKGQVRVIEDMYRGAHDSRGRRLIKGFAVGSESAWVGTLVPHAGNRLSPDFLANAGDFANYLFYEHDPGVAPSDLTKVRPLIDSPPHAREYGWWQFNVDDVSSGKGDLMARITDARDADLKAFFANETRKLLLYHGWSDPIIQPEPTLDYYREVISRTFGGDVEAARRQARLFMVPGMDHCSGGVGPSNWGDQMAPLVDWVENGKPPDFLVAVRRSEGVVVNERKICAYPQRAVYIGPSGDQNNPANWRAGNFACR